MRGASPFFFDHFSLFSIASTMMALPAIALVESLGVEEIASLFLFFSLEGPVATYPNNFALEKEMPS